MILFIKTLPKRIWFAASLPLILIFSTLTAPSEKIETLKFAWWK